MKPFHPNDDFKTVIPNSWEIQKDENGVSIYNAANGMGALQFSSYQVADINSINLGNELKDYLEDRHKNANPQTSNKCAYFNITDEDDRYWRYWLLKGANNIMFITYNCEAIDMGKEDEVVNAIIKPML